MCARAPAKSWRKPAPSIRRLKHSRVAPTPAANAPKNAPSWPNKREKPDPRAEVLEFSELPKPLQRPPDLGHFQLMRAGELLQADASKSRSLQRSFNQSMALWC